MRREEGKVRGELEEGEAGRDGGRDAENAPEGKATWTLSFLIHRAGGL